MRLTIRMVHVCSLVKYTFARWAALIRGNTDSINSAEVAVTELVDEGNRRKQNQILVKKFFDHFLFESRSLLINFKTRPFTLSYAPIQRPLRSVHPRLYQLRHVLKSTSFCMPFGPLIHRECAFPDAIPRPSWCFRRGQWAELLRYVEFTPRICAVNASYWFQHL